MPYIDTTPKDYPLVFDEDNLQDVFCKMLEDNGWTRARTFYKAVVDTRAYHKLTERVNYAVAKHTIMRNADGAFFGMATVAYFYLRFKREDREPIRRPHDDSDPKDKNFNITPSWNEWVIRKFDNTRSTTNLYFYTLEKLPNESLVPNNSIISMVVMPGMNGTYFEVDRDRDREDWSSYYYGYKKSGEVYDYDNDPSDLEFDGKILSASPFYVTRAALDIEVLGTYWDDKNKEAVIDKEDYRVMQSPIVKTTLRAEFLEHISSPIWHTNWWTDSEVQVKGYVDSTSIFLTLQADNAPMWEKNLVPTVPLYFGRILSVDGDKDEGYALFAGTIPPAKRVKTTSSETTSLVNELMYPYTRRDLEGRIVSSSNPNNVFLVEDASKLPDPPALITLGGSEIVKLIEKDGNVLFTEREQLGTKGRRPSWSKGTTVARLSTNNANISNETVVSLFDFDDPGATVGEVILPLMKLYPHYPSNGVDSVIMSRSRFGARYQAHYLSWNAPTNTMPPVRMSEDGRKYPRSYEPESNTDNYKYQFNPSRYSGKIHSSRIYVVHPEEGVRGYLKNSIGFNTQSINASNLRVRKKDCPEIEYEIYKYNSIGSVSPLTKLPATQFRPVGVGIYAEDVKPNSEPIDIENDVTPPSEVTITSVKSVVTETIDVEFTLPSDEDLSHINIYVDNKLYAKGVTGTLFYRIAGLQTGFTPQIKITTVDLSGNESNGVICDPVTVA